MSSVASIAGNRSVLKTRLATSSARVCFSLRVTRFMIVFPLVSLLFTGCTPPNHSISDLETSLPVQPTSTVPAVPAEQTAMMQAALIRDNLPAYLDFMEGEVLPVMSRDIDNIVYSLKGMTEVKPGLFYHGHIDYSLNVPNGIDRLLNMNNVILQYHTMENPLIFMDYWREELAGIDDGRIHAWLERGATYSIAISTPSQASGALYTPLTEFEAAYIAARWDLHRRQNGLVSPGDEMLTNMVYLVDGGKQPAYQEAFKNIYRYHSVAFSPEGYLWLDNRSHLQNTFSPFQVTFENKSECRALLPIFEEAEAAGLRYIINIHNVYLPELSGLMQDPEMERLSVKLNEAIRELPDDNMIRRSNTPQDQQIAFFAVGNYIFAVYGSLETPAIFE